MWGELEIRNHMISFLESNSDEITDKCIGYVRYIPIEITKRFKSTIGQYIQGSESHIPMKFKFSYDYFSKHTDDEIKYVIEHEICHMLADCYYNKRCGHGKLWKDICRRYNVRPDRLIKVDEDDYKYVICCKKCGQKIYRNRISEEMKRDIKFYKHSNGDCGKGYLEIINLETGECWH